MSIWRSVGSGAIAGAVSVVGFAAIHQLLISDIWFSLIGMMAAGAACGAAVGWTYALLLESPSIRSWITFNLIFVGMFALLGAVSVVVYDPITTAAEVISGRRPPDELFIRTLPLPVFFTVAVVALIGFRYGRKWTHYAAVLLTCALLVLVLGLNVAIIGLVDVPSSAVYLIVEMFGLIVALIAVFAGAFLVLERKVFFEPAEVRV